MATYDYAVIGAGPGGYVSAIRAAQLGLKTVLIEKNDALGGCCLNVGCIPSKALLEASEMVASAKHKFPEFGVKVGNVSFDLKTMMAKKAEVVKTLTDGIKLLMKKNKVDVVQGTASFKTNTTLAIADNEEVTEIEAKNICIATGGTPIELPFMKFDGNRIISSTEALSLPKVPKQLLVIGGGAIGLEMASVWSRLGSQVTVIEMLPQIAPFADKQIATMLQRSLKAQGIEILTATKVKAADIKKTKVTLTYEDAKGNESQISGERVLLSVGRKPFAQGIGIDAVGIELEQSGHIKIDDEYRTNVSNIYAIGDVVKGPALAHKAEEEGVAVAEIISGNKAHMNYNTIPNIIYTWPELAQVGLTDAEAKDKGHEVKVGKFYFRGNGRALTMGDPDGLIKVVADKETDKLLGVHIVGPRASDMIAEAVTAMEFSASAEDLALTIHAHPTLSEALKEAALAVDGNAIHG